MKGWVGLCPMCQCQSEVSGTEGVCDLGVTIDMRCDKCQ